MPSYRLLKPLPEVITYHGGVQLTLSKGDKSSHGYTVSYRRYGSPIEALIFDGYDAADAERTMKIRFYVSDGTPGDRVLRSLEEKGYVERVD